MNCSRCGFKLPKAFPSDICDACYDVEIAFEAEGLNTSNLYVPDMAWISRLNSLFLETR